MKAQTIRFVIAVVAATLACGDSGEIGEQPLASASVLSDAKLEASTVPSATACSPLQNGVALPSLSAPAGATPCFVISVPADQSWLTVSVSGGSGNADLYVAVNAVPTLRAYDCRSARTGNDEACTIDAPAANASYYVMLYARRAFSGVSLTAKYSGASACVPLQNGVETKLAAAKADRLCYTADVPAGQASLTVRTSGGEGNADLYLRSGAVPTLRTFDCRSAGRTTIESCTITSPAAGTWYVMLNATTAFSGVALTATSNRGRLVLVSGGDQVGSINTMLPEPVVVRLEDLAGVPLSGQTVGFQVVAGGGSVTASSVTTASDGTASVRWTLGPTASLQQLRASATDPLTGETLTLTISAQVMSAVGGSLVVNSLEDIVAPPPGTVTLRSALAAAASGDTITFAPGLDGGTIQLGLVGAEHSILPGEVYSGMTYAGYQDRDYGRSALYAHRNVVIDASMLPKGITLRWNGGAALHARVLAVYGNLTMTNVTISSGYSAAEATGNTAQPYTLARGGGLAVWGTATLTRCTIAGNTVEGDTSASRDRGTYGGGIYANGLKLLDVIVSGNAAMGYGAAGGGIYSVGGARLGPPSSFIGQGNDTSLSRCTISGNRVTAQHAYGGGIFTLSGGPDNLATMYVSNCTVARNLVEDNTALPQTGQYYYRGGGIYMGGGSLYVVASTIAENEVNGPSPDVPFGGKPNVGGGGVAATIGNAHTVEYVYLQNSIVVGNKLNGAAEDWFPGSILDFRSRGYNLVGRIDFGQILVPVPAWMDLNRRRWPKLGDEEAIALADALDLNGAHRSDSVISVGTDTGEHAVLWYPPSTKAIDKIPDGQYTLTYVDGGYSGYGVATDDFLRQVILQLRKQYGSILGSDFGSALIPPTGTTWYEQPVIWPSDPNNEKWIQFWRALDVELAGRLGQVGLGDGFWGTFRSGPVGNEWITIQRASSTFGHVATDQTGKARPSGALVDIGAIEK
ncbi:pre-peptidase C-terminal domain-containing protein [Anaeromyxobacter terrae]|uniref:pre-peptidase C-terminal domain-containing protein n=1 Tax=Anaeromyxobacter terrae TaxID=2925406 RepID=UPI001F582FB3|nr:pre-peptidase C-terminal domain-containing protein [Anaeromyxobacter sp. SG22]